MAVAVVAALVAAAAVPVPAVRGAWGAGGRAQGRGGGWRAAGQGGRAERHRQPQCYSVPDQRACTRPVLAVHRHPISSAVTPFIRRPSHALSWHEYRVLWDAAHRSGADDLS